MNAALEPIAISGLAMAFLPSLLVIAILFRWQAQPVGAIYATARMLIQLLLIGYLLVYIFESDNPWLIGAVLMVMLAAAAWIAIRPLPVKSVPVYGLSFAAIVIGGVPTLVLVTQAVIGVQPWFSPRHIIPLAGMIFASSMTAVSLAGERFASESARGERYADARRTALQAAMIPITNSLLAVGLVTLPGMMTGQILSGVSPLIAAQYQIVVMTMIFGSTGISAAVYLYAANRLGKL